MKKTKKEQGITLIALIVTIIVLLILAGITLKLVTGSNGILARAQEAEKKHRIGAATELLELKIKEIDMDFYETEFRPATFADIVRALENDTEFYIADKELKVAMLDLGVKLPDDLNSLQAILVYSEEYKDVILRIFNEEDEIKIEYFGNSTGTQNMPRIKIVEKQVTRNSATVTVRTNIEADIEYKIELNGNQIGETVSTGEKSHTFTGLEGGKSYKITVKVSNENGQAEDHCDAVTKSLDEVIKEIPEFVLNPSTKWQTETTVTIKSTYQPTGAEVLQYKLGNAGDWTDYKGAFKLDDNLTLYGRYYDSQTKETSEGFSKTVDIIDKEKPVVQATFNQTEIKLTVEVQDEQSGLESITINKLTSEAEDDPIVKTEIENQVYETAELSKQTFQNSIKAPYMHYLRGYEIVATDKAGNETVERIDNLKIQNSSLVIMNEQDLIDFSEAVNTGTDFEGLTVKLGANITMTKNFTPIGNGPKYFDGTFDGCGYTISDLKIDNTDNLLNNVGMFGSVGDKSTIQNLKLENATIEGGKAQYTGGLVGCGDGNINQIGMVNCTISSGGSVIGAMVGDYERKASGGVNYLEKSYVEGGTVKFSGEHQQNKQVLIGGLVGSLDGIVENCYSTTSLERSSRRKCTY